MNSQISFGGQSLKNLKVKKERMGGGESETCDDPDGSHHIMRGKVIGGRRHC